MGQRGHHEVLNAANLLLLLGNLGGVPAVTLRGELGSRRAGSRRGLCGAGFGRKRRLGCALRGGTERSHATNLLHLVRHCLETVAVAAAAASHPLGRRLLVGVTLAVATLTAVAAVTALAVAAAV